MPSATATVKCVFLLKNRPGMLPNPPAEQRNTNANPSGIKFAVLLLNGSFQRMKRINTTIEKQNQRIELNDGLSEEPDGCIIRHEFSMRFESFVPEIPKGQLLKIAAIL